MPVQHTITGYDTIIGIAQKYLGDGARWKEITDYNALDAPYIVTDGTIDPTANFGHGYVYVVRSSFTSPLVIKAGWTFTTKTYATGGIKVFEVTETTVIPVGVPAASIHVRCTSPGVYGNVSAGMITEVGTEFMAANVNFAMVINPEAFTGGSNNRVLQAGDVLYIPIEGDATAAPVSTSLAEMTEAIGGEDLALDIDGYLVIDGFGDVGSLSGLDNIGAAISQRLMTEVGTHPLHPEYGTKRLSELVSETKTSYSDSLAKVDILQTMLDEERVSGVEVLQSTVANGAVQISIVSKVAETNQEIPTNITVGGTGNVV